MVTAGSATLFLNDVLLPTVYSDGVLSTLVGTVGSRFPSDSVDNALIASGSAIAHDRIIQIMDILREWKLTSISVTRMRA